MFALTWNIGGKEAARAALYQFLKKRRGRGVVAVQEWVPYRADFPEAASLQQEIEASTGGRFTLAAAGGKQGRQVLIVSSAYTVSDIRTPGQSVLDQAEGAEHRLVSASIACPAESWSGLRVVGVHARSQIWADEDSDRAFHIGKLATALSAHVRTGPAIVLGDFNAQPYSDEMTWKTNLATFRERRALAQHPQNDDQVPSLYNPTWVLLRDSSDDDRPAGTYYHDRKVNQTGRWHCYDQILVSREFAECWRSAWNPNLLPRLSGHHALNNGRPLATSLSDHVPVMSLIPVPEVLPCPR